MGSCAGKSEKLHPEKDFNWQNTKVRRERTALADTPVDRKEVACPAVVHNTAFSVVIKGFKPLDNGRAKSETNKCFLYKRPFQCVKRFLKVKEK